MTRIAGLQVENFKRIKALDITVEGNKVVLAGRNAQGKSSVLDAIFYAIGGRAGAVDRPVRDGENKAEVTVTLDDIIVRRTTTAAGRSQIEVKARDGVAKYTKPQQILDSLTGKLSFDPLAFANSDEKKQLATLKEVVDLEVDLDKLARQRQITFERRTMVNRDVKRLRTVVEEYEGPTTIPDADSATAHAKVTEIRRVVRRRQDLLTEHARITDEITRLQTRLEEIVQEGRTLAPVEEGALEAAEQEYAEALQAEAQTAAVARFQSDRDELAVAEQEAAGLTDMLTELDQTRTEALAKARFPIEGLGFGEDGVLWNGVPFSQASSAERIRVSVAMAMALNPDLRVILIENASLLDSDMLATIQDLAEEKDYQIWYEVVGDDVADATVVIEDGEEKA